MSKSVRERETAKMVERREKVIVVDDEPAARNLVNRILTKEGYDCEEVDTTTQVLEKLKETNPELVILDIRMPGKSGIELLQEIKVYHPDTAVIMVTAVNDVTTAVQCIKMGAEDYICKPYKKEEFTALVEKTLHKREQQIKVNVKKRHMEDMIPTEIKEKVLACLNTIETPQELKNAMNIYIGKPVFGTLSAKRIIDARAELGEFKELQEVTVLRGIGEKRFNILMNALGQKE